MTDTDAQAIETLLLEERRYPPPPEFAAQANAQPEHLRRGLRGVLGARGPRAHHLVRAVHDAARMGAAVREVVPRRQAQHRLQLRRPPRRGRPRRPGRLLLGGGARRRPPRDHLRRPAARGRPLRERAQAARRRQGHAGRDLPRDGPRGARRDAGLRAARRAAHGRLRRLLRRLALRPAERHGLQGADHAGRGLAPRLDRRRSSGPPTTRSPSRRRSSRCSSSAAPAATCR